MKHINRGKNLIVSNQQNLYRLAYSKQTSEDEIFAQIFEYLLIWTDDELSSIEFRVTLRNEYVID